MSKGRQFVYAARTGNIEELNAVWASFTSAEQQATLQAGNYSAFRWAASKGYVPFLEKLQEWATPAQQQAMILEDEYFAFRKAAEYGHIKVLEKLWGWAARYTCPDFSVQQAMLKTYNYEAFRSAAANGHVQVLEKLWGWAARYTCPDFSVQRAMLKTYNYEAFRSAAANGHVQVVEKLRGWASPVQQQAMLQAPGGIVRTEYYAFSQAAYKGDIQVIEKLWEMATPTSQKAMLQSDGYIAFRFATNAGRLQVVEKLWGWATPAQRQAILQVDFCSVCTAFSLAAREGHVQVIEKLWEIATPTSQKAMLKADYYGAFRLAAENGHVLIIEKLWGWAAIYGLQQAMLLEDEYFAFSEAAKRGHAQVIEKLWRWANPEQQQAMLQADNYYAFRRAAARGHVQVIGKLWGLVDREQQQAMLQANNYYAFRHAAARGHVQVIEKLWGLVDREQRKAMFQADNYYAFRLAAAGGYVQVIENYVQVIEKLRGWATPAQQQEMLQAENYAAFRWAAYKGDIQVIEKLWEMATPISQQEMLQANNYYAFCEAAKLGHVKVIEKLWGWADEKTKTNVISESDILHSILKTVAKHKNYTKLLIDICAYMNAKLYKQVKRYSDIKWPKGCDEQVAKRVDAYDSMRQRMQLHSRLGLTGTEMLPLLRPLWSKEFTDQQILNVAKILNERNVVASTSRVIKQIHNNIGLNWGSSSPHTQNSIDITKVFYNLAENRGWIRRWVYQQEVEQIFVGIMRKIFRTVPLNAIDIDQFGDQIKKHKWTKQEHTQDKEIASGDKEQVKKELITVLLTLARSSQASKQIASESKASISVAKAVCEQLFPPQSRTIEEHRFATTLQVRLQTLSHQLQKLAGNPAVLKQFTSILEEKLEKAQVDTKTEDKVIDDIIQAAMREALTRKAPLAPTAISRSGAGQTPATWKEREESKRRPSVVLAGTVANRDEEEIENEKVAQEGPYIYQIARDGNCMYRSILEGIIRLPLYHGNRYITLEQLRKKVADEIEANQGKYFDLIAIQIFEAVRDGDLAGFEGRMLKNMQELYTNRQRVIDSGGNIVQADQNIREYIVTQGIVNDYINMIQLNRAWGGPVELGIISRILGAQITVHRRNGIIDHPINNTNNPHASTIRLDYDGGHYNLILTSEMLANQTTPSANKNYYFVDAEVNFILNGSFSKAIASLSEEVRDKVSRSLELRRPTSIVLDYLCNELSPVQGSIGGVIANPSVQENISVAPSLLSDKKGLKKKKVERVESKREQRTEHKQNAKFADRVTLASDPALGLG